MSETEKQKSHWAKVIAKLWNLNGQYKLLNSEFDLNFELNGLGGRKYIVKVMRESCGLAFLDAQVDILGFLKKEEAKLPIPSVVSSIFGNRYETALDPNKKERIVWVLEKMDGMLLSEVSPKPKNLMVDLGKKIATLDLACKKFSLDTAPPKHKWDLTKPLWIKDNLSEIRDPNLQDIVTNIMEDFISISDKLNKMPNYWIHNDLNDQNLLVKISADGESFLSGILDFGDMTQSPTICNVAICSAYILILSEDGLNMQLEFLRGYHSVNVLLEEELDILYTLIMTRLAVSLVNSLIMSKGKPDDPYVTISQKGSKKFLHKMSRGKDFFTARVRSVCKFSPVKGGDEVANYLNSSKSEFHPIIHQNLTKSRVISLDPEHSAIPENPNCITRAEAMNLTHQTGFGKTNLICLGKYLEPRLIYTTDGFRVGRGKNGDRRTIHLGIDVFIPAGTDIFSPLDGRVVHSEFCDKHLDYGGFVVVEHATPNGKLFYALFGHLDKHSIPSQIGVSISKGDLIGRIGNTDVNGGWEPHLHFQLALGLGHESNWPGVCDPDEIEFWAQYCPNPARLIGINPKAIEFEGINKNDLEKNRRNNFSGNLQLSYREPVLMLRGFKNYLYDDAGRCYLDFYNNVPHVGHSHPRIADLVNRQLRLINSNTRYLHPSQKKIAEKLLSKFPNSFEVIFFVNSGSEANELALRLAKTYTENKDFITFDHGYHGNTNAALEVSPYKFNKPNGIGKRDWIHVIDCPDSYRDIDPRYQITDILDKIKTANRNIAGFISETFPSVAGQIIPQPNILKFIYEKIKLAGGVCIADEVQTGLGRLGDYYFAFEQQQILPDIVVLGKPIGNGHPIGAVVTTKKIANAFNNGIEFFSTFGGSDLSCLIANEVIDIVEDESLGENAKKMGSLLKDGLLELKLNCPFIGDVRGIGLFLGVEIVKNLETKEPGTSEAGYICNRLKENRILVGLEGPFENIIKIRPPLTLVPNDIEAFLYCFKNVLSESYLKHFFRK